MGGLVFGSYSPLSALIKFDAEWQPFQYTVFLAFFSIIARLIEIKFYLHLNSFNPNNWYLPVLSIYSLLFPRVFIFPCFDLPLVTRNQEKNEMLNRNFASEHVSRRLSEELF